MLPSCFINFIGVRGACLPPELTFDPANPVSGRFVNDLPGLQNQRIALLSDSNQVTALNAYLSAIEQGIEHAKSDMIARARSAQYLVIKDSLTNMQIAEFDEKSPVPYLAPAALDRGLSITFLKDVNSTIARLFISRVRILTNTNFAGATLKIQDGITTTITAPFNLVAGQSSTIELDYTANTASVYITLDNTAISVNNSTICKLAASISAVGGCGCGGAQTLQKTYPTNTLIRGLGWNGVTEDTQFTYGLSADASIVCDDWGLLCRIRSRIGEIMQYRAGIATIDAAMHSNRFNYETLDTDGLMKIKEYLSGVYVQRMDNLCEGFASSLRDIDPSCITCKGARVVSHIPTTQYYSGLNGY